MSKIIKAVQFAMEKHGDQKYGDKPYIYHLLGVASLLSKDFPNNEDLIISAILHDILEDTNCTYEELIVKFGVIVADTVSRLSKKENQTYEEFIDGIVKNKFDIEVPVKYVSLFAAQIKIADITFNLAHNPKPENIEKYNKALEVLKK